ncbi:MAG: outer membrane protein assembly factor BamB family protein [Planctomycetaceae bacterium]
MDRLNGSVMRALLILFLLLLPASALPEPNEVALPTDEGVARYLARGRDLAAAQEWAKAAEVFQRVIDADPGISPGTSAAVLRAALSSDDGVLFYPARELALKALASMPPEGVAAYRAAHDAEARRILLAALRQESIEQRITACVDLADAYFVSSSADDALELAGDLCLDLGRDQEALDLYRRVLDVYPKDHDRNLPLLLAKAAFCAARAGDAQGRADLLARLREEFPAVLLPVEGESVAGAALESHPLLTLRATTSGIHEEEWPVAGGNPARTGGARDLPGTLQEIPFWSFPLGARDARLEWREGAGGMAVAAHDRENAPVPLGGANEKLAQPYPAARAVVFDEVVYYKDGAEYLGRRAGSGALVKFRRAPAPGERDFRINQSDTGYRFPVRFVRPARPVALLSPEPEEGGMEEIEAEPESIPDLGGAYEDVYRFLDYGGASLLIAEGKLVSLERSLAHPPDHLLTNNNRKRRRSPGLFVYDLETEDTLWELGRSASLRVNRDPAALAAFLADKSAHPRPSVLGPGLAHAGILYTVVQEEVPVAGVFLWGVDLRDGVVRSRTLLHRLDEAVRRLPEDASIALSGGLIFVTSGAGVLAAVEARPPGRLRWIRRYARGTAGRRRAAGPVTQGFALNEPVVAGGRVLLAPADGTEILAVRVEDGTLAWSRPAGRDRAYHILGAARGHLLMAGESVLSIEIATGKVAWQQTLPDKPYGRGFLGETEAYVPGLSARQQGARIHCFDLATGKVERTIHFRVPRLGNLVNAGGRLIAVGEDWIHCFTSADAERARIDARLAAAGETPDLLLERALVSLTSEAPDARDLARIDFRRAIAAAKRKGSGDSVLRSRALDNLLAIALARSDMAALEEAEGLAAAPEQRATVTLARARVHAQAGRPADALAVLEALPAEWATLAVTPDGQRLVPLHAAAAQVLLGLTRANPEFRALFEAMVRTLVESALASGDDAALAAIPDRYGRVPPTEEAIYALADRREASGKPEDAWSLLRAAVRDLPEPAQRALAQLRLALSLARHAHLESARRERSSALDWIEKTGTRPPEDLLRQLELLVDAAPGGTRLVRLAYPLAGAPFSEAGAVFVPIEGVLPEGMPVAALYASAGGYTALGGDGQPLWTLPAPTPVPLPGGAGEVQTLGVAALLAQARLCAMVGEDLLIADLHGAQRVRARDGVAVWQIPGVEVPAAMEALRDAVVTARKRGSGHRKLLVPAFALEGDILVRLLPGGAVEAYRTGAGDLLWRDESVARTPVGPPQLRDGLLVVGYADPGLARIFRTIGGLVAEHPTRALEGARTSCVLLAPPRLDPRGRLFLVEGIDEGAAAAGLRVLDSRTGAELLPAPLPAHSIAAAVLHAGESLAVYHDGSSRGYGGGAEGNLHFIDWEAGVVTTRQAQELFGVAHEIPDGARLFVFTHEATPNLEGARLFRLDLKARAVLNYPPFPTASAYARPLLTQLHVVLAGGGAPSASVRLFERDAGAETLDPQPVFARQESGPEQREFLLRPTGGTRLDVPPSIAAMGTGLLFGSPLGTFRLKRDE